MFNLELCAEFGDYFVVEIGTIVCDNPFRDAVLADEIIFDESSKTFFLINADETASTHLVK